MHASLALEEQTVTHALRGSGVSLRGDAQNAFHVKILGMFATQILADVSVRLKQKVRLVTNVSLVLGITTLTVVARYAGVTKGGPCPISVILQPVFVGAFLVLKENTATDVLSDITTFLTVDPVIAIRLELRLINVMRTDFVNVINMEHVNARTM